jgi:hypothetical protein
MVSGSAFSKSAYAGEIDILSHRRRDLSPRDAYPSTMAMSGAAGFFMPTMW